nr:immunoglobulin heavy chain junction region [Mus musculus]
CARGNWYFDVW